MAILKVARMGHPVLRQPALPLSLDQIQSAETQSLINDMVETMREYQGVGLAAPQVHRSLQVAVIEFDLANSRYPQMGSLSLTVFVNPKIIVLDSIKQGYWEGCLSVPGLKGYVERPRKVRVEYLDRDGRGQSIEAEDFMAIVLQHELDHLAGILYIDRVEDKSKLAFLDEFERYFKPGRSELS